MMSKEVKEKVWYTLAGVMLEMPNPNSSVFYFPQGHLEHSNAPLLPAPPCPPLILCRVACSTLLADPDTDDPFVKLQLLPLPPNTHIHHPDLRPAPKLPFFAKTLTQSDANNGGGFSVPRYCADTIFPPLDYTADPPVQTLSAYDVHGKLWNFRHIYRGTPRRHLLTTGWSVFVNHKKLIAGDAIVFVKQPNGDLCVGIKRAKRGNASRRSHLAHCQPDSVIQAATLAATGKPFEVVYYPQLGAPEFCVNPSTVMRAMQIQWASGMRVKMSRQEEDATLTSSYDGVISSVQIADPIRWPHSPWRILEITWDPPNGFVERVSPWLVELVPNILPFSPSGSRTQLLQHPDLPQRGQFSVPSFPSNTLRPSSFSCYASNDTPAGIQGARHAQFSASFTDHQDLLQTDLVQGIQQPNHTGLFPSTCSTITTENQSSDENVSCLLTMGCSTQDPKSIDRKAPHLVLFGQPIFTEEQISLGFCGGPISPVTGNSSSDGYLEKTANLSDGSGSYKDRYMDEVDTETGHCKVFIESEDVGRTLDLSVLGSYEDVYRKLADMFGLEQSEMLNHVLYRNETGAVKHLGEEPFSKFVQMTKRLTILLDSSSDNLENSE